MMLKTLSTLILIFKTECYDSLCNGTPQNKITNTCTNLQSIKHFSYGNAEHFLDANPDNKLFTLSQVNSDKNDCWLVISSLTCLNCASSEHKIKVLDRYIQQDVDIRDMFMCLDSQYLSTTKEVEDTTEKKTRDMAELQKGPVFRILTLKLMFKKYQCCNKSLMMLLDHVPMKKNGTKYAASSIVYLSKKKKKTELKLVNNII